MVYEKSAITTVDNPYDPFDDFEKWYNFDCLKGYNSCCYLARLARTSDSLSDYENDIEVGKAIDKIVDSDPTGIYRKVTRKIVVEE